RHGPHRGERLRPGKGRSRDDEAQQAERLDGRPFDGHGRCHVGDVARLPKDGLPQRGIAGAECGRTHRVFPPANAVTIRARFVRISSFAKIAESSSYSSYFRRFPSTSGLTQAGNFCPLRPAIKLSAQISAMALRVPTVALAMWGAITTLGSFSSGS